MSSGQKACYEDEDSWNHFQRTHGFNHYPVTRAWGVYSLEAHWAKEIQRKENITGIELVLATQHRRQLAELEAEQVAQRKALREALHTQQQLKKMLEELPNAK